jgi:hypothetical protein
VPEKLGGRAAKAVSEKARKPVILTGNGHKNIAQLNRAKKILERNRTRGVKLSQVARYVGCSAGRAERLMDLLSEDSEFLVYMDDDVKPPRYFMYGDGP